MALDFSDFAAGSGVLEVGLAVASPTSLGTSVFFWTSVLFCSFRSPIVSARMSAPSTTGLASALKKIRDDKEPLVEAANKATAHMYIENPLRKFGGKINGLFSTHPDINERIKRLEGM